MKHLLANCLRLAWLFVLTCGVGCNRSGSNAPPPTLTAEAVPAALEKAFAKAKPELKDLAGAVAGAVRTGDFSNAYLGLQTLTGKPGLNKDQQQVMASALVTVNTLLQSAQSQGDAKAAQTLKYTRQTK